LTVLNTKLVPPIREGRLVDRPRLLDGLGAVGEHKLTLIMGPAGYGKTSLMVQLFRQLQAGGELVGWLSLDEADGDVLEFFTYLAELASRMDPGIGASLRGILDTGDPVPAATLTALFVNDLFQVERDVFLFLDDIHFVADNPVVGVIDQLIQTAPPRLHIVVSSRGTPPFHLGRLRSQRELLLVDAPALRFSISETTRLLELEGFTAVAARCVRELAERTEGWIAGLQLAIISLRAREDKSRFIASFSGDHRDVADFLAEDVLARLDEDLRDFLMQTSILRRFDARLCDALIGTDKSRAHLDRLEASSLFLFSLDDQRQWYRYHHLFAEFLQKRLREQSPDIEAALHERASAWFERHGYAEEAFSHALMAKDFHRAGRILSDHCEAIFYAGRLATLANWSARLPEDVLDEFPNIQHLRAWSLILEWRFDEASAILRRVNETLNRWGRDRSCDLETIHKLRRILLHREMMLAQFADQMPTVEVQCLDLKNDFPIDDAYLLGTIDTSLMYARREQYELDDIEALEANARSWFRRSGSRFVIVWHNSILGPSYLMMGQPNSALTVLREAFDIATEIAGEHSPLAAMPALLMSEVHYELNQTEAAQKLIDTYLPIAAEIGFVDQLVAGFVTKARLAAIRADSSAICDALSTGARMAVAQAFNRLKLQVSGERVRQLLGGNSVAAAVQVARDAGIDLARKPLPTGTVTTAMEAEAVCWARLAMAEGRVIDAAEVLRLWLKFATDRGAVRSEIRIGILLACCLRLAGDAGAARRLMSRTVARAQPTRFVRPFVDEGAPVEALLRELDPGAGVVNGSVDPVAVFVRTLLAAFHPDGAPVAPPAVAEPGHAPAKGDGEPSAPPPEALSAREVEILSLVADGLRNREIGRRLGLTEGSVKWYLQQIYDKIGSRRRLQAVTRAREFGILR
jgi:LuxR family maltose regulon positive regulatory protein